MAEIIKFRPREHKDKPNRIEALVKNQIDTYICDNCGGRFEVYFNDKPKKCPHCHIEFLKWNEDE